MEHLPAMQGVVTGYMARWLPHTLLWQQCISVGARGSTKVSGGLIAHLLPANHNLKTGNALQFSKAEMRDMQAIEDYLPSDLLKQYGLARGKGNGGRCAPKAR